MSERQHETTLNCSYRVIFADGGWIEMSLENVQLEKLTDGERELLSYLTDRMCRE